ncbi:hypothetical protein SAMN05216214_101217 [Atopomonas hussainii]|uniref:DUF2867 domain-containing protein n=1 Tax=Atopomonas hussainii TaxID=1429083 RepID=A0A1H7FIH1_9GAMM|nr:hypothetical protein [Atopomonas hussainii]SEK25047.1 hypothetical protein SAMN05216214_101217 [Atopomonas hussainii]
MPVATSVPVDSLLASYQASGAFTDCYTLTVPGAITLPVWIEAFYTSRLFKVERGLIGLLMGMPASDALARQLALGELLHFSAWQVSARRPQEIVLAVGRTRSWLSVQPLPSNPPATRLFFGSAVVPLQPSGKLGVGFQALTGFHRLYSRCLLASAAQRLTAITAG